MSDEDIKTLRLANCKPSHRSLGHSQIDALERLQKQGMTIRLRQGWTISYAGWTRLCAIDGFPPPKTQPHQITGEEGRILAGLRSGKLVAVPRPTMWTADTAKPHRVSWSLFAEWDGSQIEQVMAAFAAAPAPKGGEDE